MQTRRVFAAGIVFSLCFSASFAAGQEESTSADSGAWSPSTVTHVEYDGSVFSKLVEMTKKLPTSMMAESKSSQSRKSADLNLLGAIQLQVNEGYPLTVIRLGVFKVSFMKAVVLDDLVSSAPGTAVPSYDENPIKKAIPFDQPVFSVFDGVFLVALKGDEEVMEYGQEKAKEVATRFRVLDSLVFCLFQRDQWNDGQFAEEWFELPLTYTYFRESSRKRFVLRIVDSPFAAVFRYIDEKGVERINLFDTFIASVFKSKKSRDGESKWCLLELPLHSLVNSAKTPEAKRFTFLGTFAFSSSLKGRRGGPAFAVWHSEHRKDESGVSMFMRLPFIGPVWGSWREGGKTHQGPFPRLVFWKDYPY